MIEQDYAAEERARGAALDMRDALEHIIGWVDAVRRDADLANMALQQIGLHARNALAKAEGK